MQKYLTWLLVICGVSSIFMVCFACYTYWPKADSSLPAWVQAIGSVIGILIAVAIPFYQASQQRMAVQLNHFDKLINFSLAGIKFSSRFNSVLKGLAEYSSTTIPSDVLAFYSAQFDALSRTIDSLPYWEADIETGSRIAHLQLLCHNVASLLLSLKSPQISVDPDFSGGAEVWLKNSMRIGGELQAIHDEFLLKRERVANTDVSAP